MSKRFMLLVIPKGYEKAAPGTEPDAAQVAEMMKFNQALQDAGILRALDGLHPPSMGARVSYKGGKPTVTDGPFIETHEVLGGYWIIEVGSKDDAVAWAKRAPMGDDEIIEVRPIQSMDDFSDEVQAAAAGFEDLQGG